MMNNQICTIERGDNGFIIRTSDEEIQHTQVYEDKYFNALVDSESAFMEALKEAFRYIMDYFGVFNNKHDKKALSVEVVDWNDFPVVDTLNELRKQGESYDNVEPNMDESDMENYIKEREECFDT